MSSLFTHESDLLLEGVGRQVKERCYGPIFRGEYFGANIPKEIASID